MKKTLLFVCAFFVVMSYAQSPVSLKLNLEKGKVNVIKASTTQNIQNTVNGTVYNTEVNTQSTVSFKLISQLNDVMNIEFKFDTLYSKSNSPGGVKENNSAVSAKSSDYMGLLLNRFSTYTIIAKISTSGKFLGFENYISFRDNILLFLDSVPENKRPQIRQQVDMIVTESAIRTTIEPLFAYLPENKVSAGDEWETTCTLAAGGVNAMTFNTFTLDKIDGNLAQLSVKSELESIPDTEPSKGMSIDLKGNSSGSYSIDVKTGLITRGNEEKHYTGVLTMNNNGNEMKIPMVIEAKTELSKQ